MFYKLSNVCSDTHIHSNVCSERRTHSAYNAPSKILLDCFMEHGASGSPVLTNTSPYDISVVGLFISGFPKFCFELPYVTKDNFEKIFRF